MRSFTQADGLQDNEFSTNCSAPLPDGHLAFGGLTGMTIFDPLTIREEITVLPVVLTSLKINNETVEAGSSASPLAASVNSLETLELNHTQTFLTFELAGLEFVKPQQSVPLSSVERRRRLGKLGYVTNGKLYPIRFGRLHF